MRNNASRWWVPLVMLLLFGCGGSPDSTGTGSIAVRATWPGDGQTAARTAAAAPAGVTTVRVIVEGEGMSPITRDFSAAAGQGTVSGVPAGSNRTVKLQGLVGTVVVYEGMTSGISVTAGQTSDAGMVAMLFVGEGPGVVVAPGTVSVSEASGSGTFTVVLGAQPDDGVVISISSADGSPVQVSAGGSVPGGSASLTFNSTDWDTAQTVTVSGIDNDVAEGSRDVTVVVDVDAVATTDTTGYKLLSEGDVGDVTVTVTDDDGVGVGVAPAAVTVSESAGTATFDVVLQSQPDGDVVLRATSGSQADLLVSAGGATAVSVDLTFTASDWNVAQTVSVTGVDNAIDEGSRTVSVVVDVDAAATADTTGYKLLAAGDVSDVTVTVTDDDGVGVGVVPTTLTVSENAGTATLDVVLQSQPDGDVILRATSGSQADLLVSAAGATAVSTDLTFTAGTWNVAQTVTVIGVDNALVDGTRDVTVALAVVAASTTDTTGYAAMTAGDVSDVVVTVQDDDSVAGGSLWGQMQWDVGKWQ